MGDVVSGGIRVELRPAVRQDRDFLWRWRNDPETRRASLDKREVHLEEHTRWLDEVLARPDRRLYVSTVRGAPVGTVRLDLSGDAAEVSITIAPEDRGRGLGTAVLRATRREAAALGLRQLTARIKPKNTTSRRIFERSGFTLVCGGDPLTLGRSVSCRVVAAIQARMGSTRLPGKVLRPIAGRPTLLRIAERLARCREVDAVVVSTSGERRDDPVAVLAAREGLACVRASEMDLIDRLGRTLVAAGGDALVRITGDCPLLEPELVDRLVAIWRQSQGDLEYVSNVFPSTFPHGLDVEVLSREVFERLDREVSDPFFRESLTAYIREHPESFRMANLEHTEDLSSLRWTVDYPEDLEFVERVYEALAQEGGSFGMREVLALLGRRPEIREINRHLEDTTVIRGIRGATYHEALRRHGKDHG